MSDDTINLIIGIAFCVGVIVAPFVGYGLRVLSERVPERGSRWLQLRLWWTLRFVHGLPDEQELRTIELESEKSR